MNPQDINQNGQPQAAYSANGLPAVPDGSIPTMPQPANMAPAGGLPPAQPVMAAYQPPAPSPQMAFPPNAAVPPPVNNAGGNPVVGTVTPPQSATPKAPVSKSNPNSTQNVLQIAEIRDGIVIMNDGTYRSVVMAKSINFDLMSPQEQEAVEYSYQGFLNSLYFPIQIFIRSQKVDLQPYIERLDKIRSEHDNMLLALLMEDYLGFIDQLSQHTNIMDKKFYLVVPYFPQVDIDKLLGQSKNFFSGLGEMFSSKDKHVVINEADLEAAKTELRNRVQSLLSGLMQCGIQALPLDTQELIELYYDTYNPDTATRQQLKNFGGMNSDIVTKGRGAAPQTHLQGELQ